MLPFFENPQPLCLYSYSSSCHKRFKNPSVHFVLSHFLLILSCLSVCLCFLPILFPFLHTFSSLISFLFSSINALALTCNYDECHVTLLHSGFPLCSPTTPNSYWPYLAPRNRASFACCSMFNTQIIFSFSCPRLQLLVLYIQLTTSHSSLPFYSFSPNRPRSRGGSWRASSVRSCSFPVVSCLTAIAATWPDPRGQHAAPGRTPRPQPRRPAGA